jgi:hypothetical protein
MDEFAKWYRPASQVRDYFSKLRRKGVSGCITNCLSTETSSSVLRKARCWPPYPPKRHFPPVDLSESGLVSGKDSIAAFVSVLQRDVRVIWLITSGFLSRP